MKTISASSNASAPYVGYSSDIPWTVAFSLQFFVSIIGNALILRIVYKDIRLKTSTNYLVANMAVSDLFATLVAIPNQILFMNTGKQWLLDCNIHVIYAIFKLFSFAIDVCFMVSVISCVFIAIERYYAVSHPLSRPFQGKMKCIIAGIWLLASILSSPGLYFRLVAQTRTKLKCTVSPKNLLPVKLYVYIVLAGISCLSVVLIIITYTCTVYKLYRHKAPGLANSVVRRRVQQNRKVLKMAVTIAALLYFCQGTWFIYNMLLYEGKISHLSPTLRHKLNRTTLFLLFLSLGYNFFIYVIFNDIYRQNIKAMLSKCCRHYRL